MARPPTRLPACNATGVFSCPDLPDRDPATFVAAPEQTAHDLARSTDHAVDRLWSGAAERGAIVLVNRLSRLICDGERFADNRREQAAAANRGAVDRKTCDGGPLRRDDFTERDRRAVLERYWIPWQDAVADAVDELWEQYRQLSFHCERSVMAEDEFDQADYGL